MSTEKTNIRELLHSRPSGPISEIDYQTEQGDYQEPKRPEVKRDIKITIEKEVAKYPRDEKCSQCGKIIRCKSALSMRSHQNRGHASKKVETEIHDNKPEGNEGVPLSKCPEPMSNSESPILILNKNIFEFLESAPIAYIDAFEAEKLKQLIINARSK